MQEQIDVELINPDTPVAVDVQDFMPLYSRVHVWGLFSNNPAEVMHGIVCSPLVPYYHGNNLATGYLVKLDKPITTASPGQGDQQCNGQIQVVFMHYSNLEYIGGGDAPTEGDSNV